MVLSSISLIWNFLWKLHGELWLIYNLYINRDTELQKCLYGKFSELKKTNVFSYNDHINLDDSLLKL